MRKRSRRQTIENRIKTFDTLCCTFVRLESVLTEPLRYVCGAWEARRHLSDRSMKCEPSASSAIWTGQLIDGPNCVDVQYFKTTLCRHGLALCLSQFLTGGSAQRKSHSMPEMTAFAAGLCSAFGASVDEAVARGKSRKADLLLRVRTAVSWVRHRWSVTTRGLPVRMC